MGQSRTGLRASLGLGAVEEDEQGYSQKQLRVSTGLRERGQAMWVWTQEPRGALAEAAQQGGIISGSLQALRGESRNLFSHGGISVRTGLWGKSLKTHGFNSSID